MRQPIRTLPARTLGRSTFALATLVALTAQSGQGQDVGDPARLAGVLSVAVRAEAEWDDLITTSAGGATADQFRQALQQTFAETIEGAGEGPRLIPDAPNFLLCHVDTFYDTGLIIYSVRVEHHQAGADGRPVVTWIKSSVGSYGVQQLHLMLALGEQCAETFIEDWLIANPGA